MKYAAIALLALALAACPLAPPWTDTIYYEVHLPSARMYLFTRIEDEMSYGVMASGPQVLTDAVWSSTLCIEVEDDYRDMTVRMWDWEGATLYDGPAPGCGSVIHE